MNLRRISGLSAAALAVLALSACKSTKTTSEGATGAPAVAQSQPSATPVAFDAPPPVGTVAKCPVTGETFTVSDNTARSEHDGKHYVFCCPECKPDFDKEPGKYTAGVTR